MTVSIGIATTCESIQTSSELYIKADKALYHAKYSGKNRAIQYQDSMQNSNQRGIVPNNLESILNEE